MFASNGTVVLDAGIAACFVRRLMLTNALVVLRLQPTFQQKHHQNLVTMLAARTSLQRGSGTSSQNQFNDGRRQMRRHCAFERMGKALAPESRAVFCHSALIRSIAANFSALSLESPKLSMMC
eukprot:1658696-Amphidinium_carterae.1